MSEAQPPLETREQHAKREEKTERVAIVFAHGQGEQVPMEDVLELARTVWTSAVDPQAGDRARDVWSVPIYDADMSEQRRLVTGMLRRPGEKDLKVDFYQFYWADLMVGNRFVQLWRWVLHLVKRKRETPPPLLPLRRLILGLGLFYVLLSVAFGATTVARLLVATDTISWATFYAAGMSFLLLLEITFLLWPRYWAMLPRNTVLISVASWLLGFWAPRLTHGHEPLLPRMWWGLDPSTAHSVIAAFSLMMWAGGLALLARAYFAFLVPVMADSARMFADSPENVPVRDRVRKRGMELLEALHFSDRHYDRIIVVAHSLGTAVAYNVLSQYWGTAYRFMNHDATKAERAQVEAASQALNAAGEGVSEDPHLQTDAQREALRDARRKYREAARAYQKALADPQNALLADNPEWDSAEFSTTGRLMRESWERYLRHKGAPDGDKHYRPPWLITDFITLGSPLTYGGFLMAQSRRQFRSQFVMRRLPECPPAMDPQKDAAADPTTGERPSTFTFSGKPHHASPFAATCWTNLFFETKWLFWRGDLIGGPVSGAVDRGRFGWGPLDVAVRRCKGIAGFAHSEYWRLPRPPRRARTDEDGPQPHLDGQAEHVTALRAALRLFGHDARDEKVLEFLAPPGTNRKALKAFLDGLDSSTGSSAARAVRPAP